MFKFKKGYLHHPFVIAFILGVVVTIIVIYLLNHGMIPGVRYKFC
jgi:hypothetical protein